MCAVCTSARQRAPAGLLSLNSPFQKSKPPPQGCQRSPGQPPCVLSSAGLHNAAPPRVCKMSDESDSLQESGVSWRVHGLDKCHQVLLLACWGLPVASQRTQNIFAGVDVGAYEGHPAISLVLPAARCEGPHWLVIFEPFVLVCML